jgi:hypothetical protein
MPHCEPCDRDFPHWRAYYQHMHNSNMHHYCGSCDKDFSSSLGLTQHYVQSPRHAYCQRCDEHFEDKGELGKHYRKSTAHHMCISCKKDFESASNLRSHMNSSVHKPKVFECHFKSHGCKKVFVSSSAVILHLEAGTCVSGCDRAIVNREVRRLDKRNVITDPLRLLTSSDDTITFRANGRAWTGNAFECYICHKEYPSLNILNQHLASPKHQDKVYICPLSTCRARFNTLSGLWQHIESEKCGVARFRIVKAVMDRLEKGWRTLRLTN